MDDTNSSSHETAQPEGLRERKKRLAQAAIEEAALRLFQEKGYEQTSIQDIADAVMMSARTFFRYFASKEEVLFGLFRTAARDGLRSLQQVPATASPHAALRVIFGSLASRYQQQRSGFQTRFQVAKQTPSLASLFLYALMEPELTICDALCVRFENVTNRNEIRFLVAIHMAALRVSVEEWLELEEEDDRDLVSLLNGHMDSFSRMRRETP